MTAPRLKAVPTELNAEYYAQRASHALVITEGTQPSADGQGYLLTPGIHNDEQIARWRKVTDAVHAAGGRVVIRRSGRLHRLPHPHRLRNRTMPTPEPRIPTTAGAGPMSYAIFQLARAHRAYAASLLREMDLHPGQELLLMHLLDRDGQSQSELLECLGVDHSTISKALRRMQDAGLVIREPAAHDRRVMVVHLTDKGRAMREPIAALWQSLEETSARNLSEQQAESFVHTAYAITEAISSRALPQEESA